MKKILIICPAYNEATKLPKLIDEFKKTDHFNNLFVINSGSTDDTESILTKNNILHISLPINKGGGYAIVHQFCSIGSYSFCAMGSAVNKDIPAYVKVRGNPAKPFGINVTGIKRIGYSKETIEALRSAYRSIYRKKLTVDEAVKDLDSLRKEFKEVDIFLSSVEDSKRGISR